MIQLSQHAQLSNNHSLHLLCARHISLLFRSLLLQDWEGSSPRSFHEGSLLSQSKETFLYLFPIKVTVNPDYLQLLLSLQHHCLFWFHHYTSHSLKLSLFSQSEVISFMCSNTAYDYPLEWKDSLKARTPYLFHHCFPNTKKNMLRF